MTDPPASSPEQAAGETARASARPQPVRPSRPSAVARLRANPATSSFILVTALVFVGQFLSQQLLGFDLLLGLGAKSNDAILSGQIWRYFTPVFLHIGLLHLFVNMYSLYVIGPAVERPFGGTRLVLIYLLSGVAGVAASLAFSPHGSAGASGAIFGLLGALGGFLYMHRELFGSAAVGQLRHIIFVAVINLAIGLSPGIDNWGHLGGLLAGIAMAFLLGPQYEKRTTPLELPRLVDQRRGAALWRRAILAGLAVVLISLLAALSPINR
jgi:rhomboid protease GluP